MKRYTIGSLVWLSSGAAALAWLWVQQDSPQVSAPQQAAKVQVSVVGAVKSPGRYQVDVSEVTTKRGLFSILVKAGLGDIDFAAPIKIKRGNTTLKSESLLQICQRAAKTSSSPSGITLRNGDVVVVPIRKGQVSFEVVSTDTKAHSILKSKSVSLPARGTLSLRKALAMVGYKPVPVPGRTYEMQVFRGNQIIKVDMTAPTGPKHDFLLRDADTVMISLKPAFHKRPPHFMTIGHVKFVGFHDFPNAAKLTIADALKLAGGINNGQADDVVALIRFGKEQQETIIAQFPSTLDSKDREWKQQVQDFDSILIGPEDLVRSFVYRPQDQSPVSSC